MAHTPGPWRFNADLQEVDNITSTLPFGSPRRRVATVHGYDAEYEANARLIAAVPAMVEELLWIRENLHPRALRRAATDAELIAITRATKVLREAGVIPTPELEAAP